MLNDTVEDSVELASGGRLAALGVYHELHCLVGSLVLVQQPD